MFQLFNQTIANSQARTSFYILQISSRIRAPENQAWHFDYGATDPPSDQIAGWNQIRQGFPNELIKVNMIWLLVI